jgi:hypothetical protein
MTRKRTKRKVVYNLINPLVHAIEGAAITDTRALDKLRLMELSAIEAFRTGSAAKADWDTMANLMNLTELMAREVIGPEALPVCERAQEALVAAWDRHAATGRMGIDGPGLQALRELAEYHDAQRSSISRKAYEDAIRRCTNKVKDQRAKAARGQIAPDTRVLS